MDTLKESGIKLCHSNAKFCCRTGNKNTSTLLKTACHLKMYSVQAMFEGDVSINSLKCMDVCMEMAISIQNL